LLPQVPANCWQASEVPANRWLLPGEWPRCRRRL